jgi:hypothetical protein
MTFVAIFQAMKGQGDVAMPAPDALAAGIAYGHSGKAPAVQKK